MASFKSIQALLQKCELSHRNSEQQYIQKIACEKYKNKLYRKQLNDLRISVDSLTRENERLWKLILSKSSIKPEKSTVNGDTIEIKKEVDYVDLTTIDNIKEEKFTVKQKKHS